MKKILLSFCLLLSVLSICAQAGKTTKPAKPTSQPNMNDLQKMLDDAMKGLSPEEQGMAKDMLQNLNLNTTQPASNSNTNISVDSWYTEDEANANDIGSKTSKTIGPSGGNITSSNGKISIDFPAGAITKNTEISIEEILNADSSGIGNAFSIEPKNLLLIKPVQVTMKYTDKDVDGTSPDLLKNVVQDENGKSIIKDPVVDKKNETVKITADELNEISLIASVLLKRTPDTYTLGREQSVSFKITAPTAPIVTSSLSDRFKITAWKLDGIVAPINNKKGILKVSNQFEAQYTAPKEVPLYDRIANISVDILDVKSGAKVILISHVFLSTKDFFNGQLDHKVIHASNGLDPAGLAKIKSKQEAGINYVQCTKQASIITILLSDISNPGAFFTIRIKDPHIGINSLQGTENEDEDMPFVGGMISSTGYNALIETHVIKTASGCDVKPIIFHKFNINLTKLDLKSGGLVQGYFGGTVYVYKEGEGKCRNPEQSSISGDFSLTIVAVPGESSDPATSSKPKTPPPPPPPLTPEEIAAIKGTPPPPPPPLTPEEIAAMKGTPPAPPPPLTPEEIAAMKGIGNPKTTGETISNTAVSSTESGPTTTQGVGKTITNTAVNVTETGPNSSPQGIGKTITSSASNITGPGPKSTTQTIVDGVVVVATAPVTVPIGTAVVMTHGAVNVMNATVEAAEVVGHGTTTIIKGTVNAVTEVAQVVGHGVEKVTTTTINGVQTILGGKP